jgi:hypothetical protein
VLQIESRRQLYRELERIQSQAKERTWFQKLNSFVYVRCILMYNLGWPGLWLRAPAALETVQAAYNQAVKEKAVVEEEVLQPTGNAIIVFNHEQSATNMKQDFRWRLPGSTLTRMLQRTFHVATCSLPCVPLFHALHCLQCRGNAFSSRRSARSCLGNTTCHWHCQQAALTTCECTRQQEEMFVYAVGLLSYHPRMTLDLAKGGTTERCVIVRRAPEPNDLLWSNICLVGMQVVMRRALLGAFYVGLLVCTLA